MADTKISGLTDGTTAIATDRIPVARSPFASGDNRYITPAYVKDYILGLANSWTAGQTVSGAGLTFSGNISAAAWTTTGLKLKETAATLTDTSSSGTVAAAYTHKLGGNTIAASSAATFTDYFTAFLTGPTAGANVTFTNRWALGLSGSLKITPFADSSALAVTSYSLTGSNASPVVDLTGTWNTSGTVTAIRLNLTNTASNGASLLIDLRTGGTSRLNCDAFGNLTASSGVLAGTSFRANSSGTTIGSNIHYGISSTTNATGAIDTFLLRDAANTWAQRNGTTAQTKRIYRTFTDASNYERLALQTGAGYVEMAAETAGTGTDDLDVRLTPTGTGGVNFPGGVLLKTRAALTDGAAAQAGTLANAPTAGNPTKWIPINDNGTTRYIPCW